MRVGAVRPVRGTVANGPGTVNLTHLEDASGQLVTTGAIGFGSPTIGASPKSAAPGRARSSAYSRPRNAAEELQIEARAGGKAPRSAWKSRSCRAVSGLPAFLGDDEMAHHAGERDAVERVGMHREGAGLVGLESEPRHAGVDHDRGGERRGRRAPARNWTSARSRPSWLSTGMRAWPREAPPPRRQQCLA